jgi:hypothetical protein
MEPTEPTAAAAILSETAVLLSIVEVTEPVCILLVPTPVSMAVAPTEPKPDAPQKSLLFPDLSTCCAHT